MTLAPLSTQGKRVATDLVMLLAVVGAGLLCTAAIYSNLRESAALRVAEQRNALGETVVAALDHDATSTLEAVRGAAMMAEMAPGMTEAQFGIYTQRLMASHPGVAALQWFRAENNAGYVYPAAVHAWTLDARAPIAEAQKDARVVGTPIATAPFLTRLPTAAAAITAVAITVPVYQRSEGSDSINRHIGFINALVDLPALMREAAYQAQAAQTEMLVQDQMGATPSTLFSSLSQADHVMGHDSESGRFELADHQMELHLGARDWMILLHPQPAAFAGTVWQPTTLAVILGLLVTGMLTILLARSQRNRRLSEQASAQEQSLRDKLLAEQYRLKEVVESTDVAVWEYDLRTRFLSVSERWHTVSGYARDELGDNVLHSWMALVHPEDLPVISATFARMGELDGDRFEYEYRMRQKNGSWMWVNSRAHVVERDADGMPIKVAGINLEVTRQKEAELRIHALNASLEAQMQDALARSEARATLGTLIASVSHEMATPMGNSMMTASTLHAQASQFEQQLETGALRKSELTQFVSQIRDGNALLLRNLERAVSLLKNFRQVAADQASEQRRTFDLHQSVQEIVATLKPSLKHEKHQVVVDIPDGIRMTSYPGPVGQVLINLINNAYLHAFEGMEHGGEFRITASSTDTHVTLVCSDNGRGITPETLEKMFQPFFSTRIGRGGTGLGMTIVDNLVKTTLGGQLQVNSSPGKGTTVTITLPLQAPDPRSEDV